MNAEVIKIKNCMRSYLEYCRDGITDEINHTQLAECVADELNIYENDDYDIPEWLFDMALEFN